MKKIIKQMMRFIGISGIGWILDFCVYASMGMLFSNLVMNNIISSWIGVTFVFVFATRNVFKNNSNISLKLKYFIYLFYQCVLIYFISKFLNVINSAIVSNIEFKLILKFSSIIAKILVTPITMIVNFFAMKCIVEKL